MHNVTQQIRAYETVSYYSTLTDFCSSLMVGIFLQSGDLAKNLEEPSPSLKVCTDNSTYSFIVCDGIALDITQSGVSAFIALVAVCFGFQFSYPVIYEQLLGFI